MKVFLVYVRDENFCRLLPKELDKPRSDNGRIKVMAFPPLGIQTLAPVSNGYTDFLSSALPARRKRMLFSSFRFAARLKLDTFGLNRLCACRGTPLWQEYVNRSIIDDQPVLGRDS